MRDLTQCLTTRARCLPPLTVEVAEEDAVRWGVKVSGENEGEGGSSAQGEAEEGRGQPQDAMSRHRGAKGGGGGRGEALWLRR